MAGKASNLLVALVLLATLMPVVPRFRGSRCLCIGPRVNSVTPMQIKSISVFLPTSTCDRKEVIVTLKKGKGQRCLNLDSKQAQLILKRIVEIKKVPQEKRT
ncbi:C-X-C motif chemokine 11 [Ornithorhynchus anatinus]|uniref:C-X-C motif chemokine 11 n=1 Tax=Ornithorhynchus anatinus TaxID=9258 RepID=UPI00028F2F08|nr:C-X-C motif chemokine 11 [Ornithorhynchus anatinus]